METRKMKKLLMSLLTIGLLVGCSAKTQEKANTTNQTSVNNKQQSEDKYIKVSIESANSLTESASKLKTLLDNMDVENEEWQSNVEDSLSDISKAVNDYMLVEVNLTDGQSIKFKETKEYYSQGVMSFGDIIQDTRKALETYNKKALENVRDIQLEQANSLVSKASKQLEIERN